MHKFILHSIFILISGLTFAQNGDNNEVWKGNKAYREHKYEEAEKHYDKSLENRPSGTALFNKANTLYRQQKYKDAAGLYLSMAQSSQDAKERAEAFHNAGNSFLKGKELDKSIESYKMSLRYDPTDEETRYNLSYAMKLKQQQDQNQDQNKDQNKDQNQDQNKDQQDKQDQNQDRNKDQQEQEEQQKDQQQNQDQKDQEQDQQEQQQQNQPKPNEVSKEDAARMLENLENEEEKTQEQMKVEKRKTKKVNIENDW